MPKTIEINAYEFGELSEKAKDKVRKWCNSDMQLFDKYTKEEWERRLEELGYSDIDIQYSGFCSQGDGASIACSVDVRSFLTRNDLLSRFSPVIKWIDACGEELHISILRKQWGNYVHEKFLYYISEDMINTLEDNAIKVNKTKLGIIVAIAELVLEEVQEKSRELYSFLEADYDYHYTDEYVADMCEANQYLFDAYGEPVHNLEEIREEENG
jgi:hypothetical protein